MATVSLTNFLTEVLPQVPACPDAVAMNAVRNALIEFCTQSLVWQETQDPVTVASGDFPYPLEGVAGAKVVKVMSVIVDGEAVPPTSVEILDASVTNWRSSVNSVVSAYYLSSPELLALFPLPSEPRVMQLRVAYAPSRAAQSTEEFLYQKYLEGVAAGALSRLMAMPAQPWSNPELSGYYRAIFGRSIISAGVEANNTYSRTGNAVVMRSMA